MSNFTGVTFAQQKVLPSDDAIIRRAILPDGILYGCELSYSGSTLTMAAGQMLICGRQIRHPSSQNWAVVDATSGFARLLLTVDLTRTSTKEVFEQVVDSIEYAAAEDGFPELEQSDVNVSGSRYQVVACVVSLGTGGITGIVTQLQPSRVESGGGLNFSVVGGLTQPANPKENTIWVETDVDITSWIFSATEPETPAEGMVWIITGKASAAEFNALKKNSIQVYPISAKQYVSGAWVNVTAKSYQGGEWVDWIEWLFNYSTQPYEWHTTDRSSEPDAIAGKNPTVTTNSDGSITITMTKVSNAMYEGTYEMVEPYDLTGKTALTIEYSIENSGNEAEPVFGFVLYSEESGSDSIAYTDLSKNNTTDKLAFAGVGTCYIAILCRNNYWDVNRPDTVTMTLKTILAE